MAKSGGSGGRGFSIARSFGGRGFTQSEYVSNYNRTSSAMGKNGGNGEKAFQNLLKQYGARSGGKGGYQVIWLGTNNRGQAVFALRKKK